MDIEAKIGLIKEVGEEIITLDELKELFDKKPHPIAYDGFEPSGQMHIAQGLMRAINVNKMIKAGCKFKMLVADWHAWANNKMDGDLEKIQVVGKYMIEVWRASGMDVDNIEFVWANDHVKDLEYHKLVMQVARNSTLNRIIRTGQIMGRKESDLQQASQILYACMQCADIFHLKADITQLGMDQRKVNVLARELAPTLGLRKPVVISHHMLMGLGEPVKTDDTEQKALEMKMSKSNPSSAIFMTDSDELVKSKIMKAYCPAKTVENNPLAEYLRYIIFQKKESITIKRPEKYGGDLVIEGYDDFVKKYEEGKIHPADLKTAVAESLNELLEPVREHFKKNERARELLEKVSSYKVTR
ncbi:MAG: tyrosine--tRNA ligase [Nanoarchaeota archaeon]